MQWIIEIPRGLINKQPNYKGLEGSIIENLVANSLKCLVLNVAMDSTPDLHRISAMNTSYERPPRAGHSAPSCLGQAVSEDGSL